MFLFTAKCALSLLLFAGVAMGCSNKGDKRVVQRLYELGRGDKEEHTDV